MSIQSKKDYLLSLDETYLELASTPSLWELKQEDFLRALCKTISECLKVQRVSVYSIDYANKTVDQQNLYLADKNKHFNGFSTPLKFFDKIVASIKKNRIVEVSDIHNHPFFMEINPDYVKKNDIRAFMFCSLYRAGKIVGSIVVEQLSKKRKWLKDEKRFLSSVADLIAQRFTTTLTLELEERYQAVFENSADGMLLTRDSTIIDCNIAAEKLFLSPRDKILQKHPVIFSPEFQDNKVTSVDLGRKKIEAALKGETQFFEFYFKRANDDIFPADVKLNTVKLKNKLYLMVTIRDISERKKTENKIAKSNAKVLKQNRCLALLNELSNQLQGLNSAQKIYQATIDALAKMPFTPKIAIYDVSEEKQELSYNIGHGFSSKVVKKFKKLPFNSELDNFFRNTGQSIYFNDLSNEHRFEPRLAKELIAHGIQSLIEAPFIVNGERTAVLYLAYQEINSVSPEIVELLFSISATISLALENAQSSSKLDHMAHHDSLTHLGNRALFHKDFKQKVQNNAVLYLLDLDHFKEINDTLGHFTGDRILQKIGQRLNQLSTQHEYLVCRLGGDEFIVLSYGVSSRQAAKPLATSILECLREPFQLEDLNLEIDASIGIAMYPLDGKNSHELLRSADVAMYQAKQTSSGFAFYQQDQDIHTPERLTMIADLGSAIDKGQLLLHYQPKLSLNENKIVGFEALVRWQHPSLGLLRPGKFIPLIEMSNLIFQLTEDVLHQALAQQKKWLEQGYSYTVAVNISARNLIDDRIIKLLDDMLKFYGTPENMLELEITETALMHDAYRATNYLKQISDLGIRLSIDDFGTGYSSLAYMNKLPIHKLKLDREFIMGMLNNTQGKNIVETIIALSKKLDLDVIAEGVEDQDTLEVLRTMQCDEAQGYYICKPYSWEVIEQWLNDSDYL